MNIGDRIRINYRDGKTLEGELILWDAFTITVREDNGKETRLIAFGRDIKSLETL